MNLAWLLRSWLAQQAQANLATKFKARARRTLGLAPQSAERADDLPCDVGIVFALSAESGGTEDLLSGVVTTKGDGFLVRSGTLDGRHVDVVLTGAGARPRPRDASTHSRSPPKVDRIGRFRRCVAAATAAGRHCHGQRDS